MSALTLTQLAEENEALRSAKQDLEGEIRRWDDVERAWREHDYIGLIADLYDENPTLELERIEILIRAVNIAMNSRTKEQRYGR